MSGDCFYPHFPQTPPKPETYLKQPNYYEKSNHSNNHSLISKSITPRSHGNRKSEKEDHSEK